MPAAASNPVAPAYHQRAPTSAGSFEMMLPHALAPPTYERPDRGGPGPSLNGPDPRTPSLPALGNALSDRADLPERPPLPRLELPQPPPLADDDPRWMNAAAWDTEEAGALFAPDDDSGPEATTVDPPTRRGTWLPGVAASRLALPGLVLAAVVVAILGFRWFRGGPAGPSGTLTVTSRPAGAAFLVDGQAGGVTPATVRLPAGAHVLEIRSAGPTQAVGVRVEAGGQLSRYFELPEGTAAARLHVITTPPGALVTVDGRLRGRSPLTIEDLNPGVHRVRAVQETQSLERAVLMASGATGAVNLAFDKAEGNLPAGYGLLAVSIPVEFRAFENGAPIGTSRATPWLMAKGHHELDFVNELLDFRERKVVEVLDGHVQGLEIDVPPSALSITATEGAVIAIDGQTLGAAAVVKQPLTPGQHDIVVRHPVLGERRLLVTLLPGGEVSVTVDLAKN